MHASPTFFAIGDEVELIEDCTCPLCQANVERSRGTVVGLTEFYSLAGRNGEEHRYARLQLDDGREVSGGDYRKVRRPSEEGRI